MTLSSHAKLLDREPGAAHPPFAGVAGGTAAPDSMRPGADPVVDQAAFDALFRAHAPYILRVLPRLGVPAADVEDVCQDVFVVVHRMLPGFEGRSTVRTWIYGIALRVARSHRRRAYMRREIPTEQPPEPGAHEAGACSLERGEGLELLDAALASLSDAQRELIVLFEIEELSVAEVAEATATSKFTIYSRLYAARRELKRHALRRVRLGVKP